MNECKKAPVTIVIVNECLFRIEDMLLIQICFKTKFSFLLCSMTYFGRIHWKLVKFTHFFLHQYQLWMHDNFNHQLLLPS